MSSKLSKALAKRKPAMSEEELAANIAAAESDYSETDEEKKTIAVREIDPAKVQEIEKMLKLKRALRNRKEYDKKKYQETMGK